MEQEHDLTFGQRWELRKQERRLARKTPGVPAMKDPLREREKAFMAKKEQEERNMKKEYHDEFIKKYGKF